MLTELPAGAVPKLILAGRNEAGPELGCDDLIRQGCLEIRENVSDSELAELYANCLFTAFPSKSEGYGVPVVESLCFGKLCVASDLDVIRETAGDLTWRFDPESEASAYEKIAAAVTQPEARAEAEARIRRLFVKRDWLSYVEEMDAAISRAIRAASAPARAKVEFSSNWG
jgi:glycosyltransferase involved in cell wall biosynthesis